MTERERIINKIRALLAKANSKPHEMTDAIRDAAENESIEALIMAQKLLEQHNIDIMEIDVESPEHYENQAVKKIFVRLGMQSSNDTRSDNQHWYIKLADCVCHSFNCRKFIVMSKGNKYIDAITFVGRDLDVQMCAEVYVWMVDQVWILAEYAHSLLEGTERYVVALRWKESWIDGCVYRIFNRMLQEEMQKKADATKDIVVFDQKAIDDYITNEMDIKTMSFANRKATYDDAFKKGYEHGKNMNVGITDKVGNA